MTDLEERFAALWRSLAPIGRDATSGGYLRYSWSEAELACREWFVEEALDRALTVEPDGNGNLWAWWGDPSAATRS
jgi:N-carbamoyl-L-amino-acid hydrolase